MAAPKFHTLKVTRINHETDDASIISFEIPDNLKDDYAFIPGQYLTLKTDIGGNDTRRSYSICSALGDPHMSVGVKRIKDGIFSNFVKKLKEGDEIQVMTPEGRFQAPIGGKHRYLMLAAGSGITPILSITKSVLEQEEHSHVTLCYANKQIDSVMFRDEIDDLKDRFMTRFSLAHMMTSEAQDVELFNGRLDVEKLETMATKGLIRPEDCNAIFICGPQGMIENLSAKLVEMGIDETRIKYELFTPSTPIKPKAKRKKTENRRGKTEVRIIIDGSERIIWMDEDDQLLEVAAQAGLDLPYSCANGMCSTCRCHLAEGKGEMRQNFSLEPWEMKAGFVLSCQFTPKSKSVTLDFDVS
jgi:ring-1,2-phenylacetyl-CoA epoxidase subunit PaaE